MWETTCWPDDRWWGCSKAPILAPCSAINGYRDMADGQVVLVTTEPLGGGSPVRSVHFVAEKDPEKAKAVIGAMMAPNERVEAWGRVPEAQSKLSD
jgi:hypothetical protein